MDNIIRFINPADIRHILDVGTGSGDFVGVLQRLFPGSAITGVDPAEEALAEAEKKFDSVSFLKMEAEKLQFADNTFDLTTLSNALHHLQFPEKALSEMKRVTKPGGWIVISEIISDGLNPAQENQKLYHHHRSYIDRMNGLSHRETYSGSEVLELLETNHLRPFENFRYDRIPEPERDPEKLKEWIIKMKSYQKYIPEGKNDAVLSEWFNQFEERVFIHGFQPASNLVALIRNEK